MAASSELVVPGTSGPVPARMRTVVVDGSDSFLKVTCHLLDLEAAIDLVAAASDGIEALDTVIRLQPALVVTDVYVPGLDGLALASLLAEMQPAPRVVLMSSQDSPELRAAGLRAGAFAFVSKADFRHEFEAVLEHLGQAVDGRWSQTRAAMA